jgi:hypothetical protein
MSSNSIYVDIGISRDPGETRGAIKLMPITFSTAKRPFFGANTPASTETVSHDAIAAMVDGELRHGSPRSSEYREGMIDLLCRKLNAEPMPRRYRPGTVQFDAHCSGVDRGWILYREQSKGSARKKAR